jgi:hypothetical protein
VHAYVREYVDVPERGFDGRLDGRWEMCAWLDRLTHRTWERKCVSHADRPFLYAVPYACLTVAQAKKYFLVRAGLSLHCFQVRGGP